MTKCIICRRDFQYWCYRGICETCCRKRYCPIARICGPRKVYFKQVGRYRSMRIVMNPSERIEDAED